MGGSNSSVPQQNNVFQSQSLFHNVINRLADANPDLGASILAQRKRYQSINQVNLPATILKKSISLVLLVKT